MLAGPETANKANYYSFCYSFLNHRGFIFIKKTSPNHSGSGKVGAEPQSTEAKQLLLEWTGTILESNLVFIKNPRVFVFMKKKRRTEK